MKRFLMLVGVAAVAGAMYVAASPASQQATGPTARQFKALKKQVATLSKTLKKVKIEANDLAVIIVGCYFVQNGPTINDNGLGVSQFGSASSGFLFGTSAINTPRTALDVDSSASPQHFLQEVDPVCVTGGALRHGAARRDSSLLQRWAAQHTR